MGELARFLPRLNAPVAQRSRRLSVQPRLLPYVFVSGALLITVMTNVIPFVITVWDSLHLDSVLQPDHPFIGLRNYEAIFEDPLFRAALVNTLGYLGISVIGATALGLAFAMWLREVKHAKGLLIALVLIPWAVPGTVSGAIWSLIFNPTSGFLNGVLLRLHLISTDVIWLNGPGALPLVCLTLLWQIVPIAALIMLAGLEHIPPEVYEQSAMDGATPSRTFRSVTLPLLRPVIAITVVQSAISAVNIFDQIYVLNGNAPGTLSIVQQTYTYALKDLNFGYGFSAAIVSTIVSIFISVIAVGLLYREVEY